MTRTSVAAATCPPVAAATAAFAVAAGAAAAVVRKSHAFVAATCKTSKGLLSEPRPCSD